MCPLRLYINQSLGSQLSNAMDLDIFLPGMSLIILLVLSYGVRSVNTQRVMKRIPPLRSMESQREG